MRTLFALFALTLPSLAFGLMPPHWNSITPPSGSTLAPGQEIKISGYSLKYLEGSLKIITADGQVVQFLSTVDCHSEGTGHAKGSVQQRCTGTVSLVDPPKMGTQVMLELMGRKVHYTMGKMQPTSQPAASQSLKTP